MSDNFQLGLLPERRMDWRTLATSYAFIGLVILFLIFSGLLWPDHIQFFHRYNVTEILPTPDLKPQIAPPPVVIPRKVAVRLPPVAVETPKLVLPKIAKVQPKPLPKQIEPPKLESKFATASIVPASAARAAKLPYTGTFGSSAVAKLNASPEKVQTGGFGDPDSLKGQGKNGAHLTMATLGSFDLPLGAGNGNGRGGAKGLQGTVASAGFGNGIAQPGQGDGRAHGVVIQTAFQSSDVAAHVAKRATQAGPPTTPIEITYKPKPLYTEEARQLQLQGEVLLEVVFAANGQLHVNRIVRGLGHGLDEAAIAATNTMKFRPALRSGEPVDSTAVVHVTFELAM